MIEVTLIYADGSTWFAGGFATLDDAWAWIDDEKTREYWKDDTQVQVIDKSIPLQNPPEEPPPVIDEPITGPL